jgi:hypothetical protein
MRTILIVLLLVVCSLVGAMQWWSSPQEELPEAVDAQSEVHVRAPASAAAAVAIEADALVAPAPSRAPTTDTAPANAAVQRVWLKDLDPKQRRCWQRMQDVLALSKLPSLPEAGVIAIADLQVAMVTIASMDDECNTRHEAMMHVASQHAKMGGQEINACLKEGRIPPYAVSGTEPLKRDPMDIVSVMRPAFHDRGYIIRTPESLIAKEKAAWLEATAAEADFADKVVRGMISDR